MIDGAEYETLAVVRNAGSLHVGIEIFFHLLVDRDFQPLAAFLMQPQPPALAILEVVRTPEPHDGADPPEAVDHHADERAIAQAFGRARLDRLDQRARPFALEHRRLARARDVLRALDGGSRVDGHHLADDQPIEQAPDCREVLP